MKTKLKQVMKNIITAIIIIISLFFFMKLCSTTIIKNYLNTKQINISQTTRIVDTTFIEKIYILDHSEIQPIYSNKKGYINSNKDTVKINDNFFNIYYIVYETKDTLEVSQEKFEKIHKGDVIIIKTILIQK